jgi:predicted flap endonuclease-1-like 5' DNA nuclease
MAWLMTHMWMALAATGLVTLILGWSVRGMMLSGRMRQAMVERDMVKVELGEAKDEIERLFAAQRKLTSGEAPAAPAPDPILARKVESLTAELARKSAEIDALKTSAVAAPVAAVAPAAAAAPHAEDNLLWRNRHLESRVVHLESELTKAQAAPAPVPAPAEAPAELAAPVGEPVDAAKQEWEIGYLRTRVEALQEELAAVPAAPVAAATDADEASVEEEIARLRWRVRFLEGRVAYFEGDAVAADAEEEADDIDDEVDDEMDAQPEAPVRMSEAILGQLEAADERAEAEAAAAQQVEKVRPLALDKPVEGQPDDLTLIGGIGPKIQDVLNSLGIFHFDQIADWNAGNVAWVDDYLSFTGRITREGWVEQAAVLVGESADA